MADPFVAEIRIFPFQFPPSGWARCDGQLVDIGQNTALFALLGTMYGGNGMNTFALPNLQGRAPMQHGQGPGLSLREQGEAGGSATETLTEAQLPAHAHTLRASSDPADRRFPTEQVYAVTDTPAYAATTPTPMGQEATSLAGQGLPHNNMQPYLTVNFCIALQGIFPPRW